MHMAASILLLFWKLSLLPIALADISLPSLFTNGAVFQRNINVPVWGSANADETIDVEFNGQSKTTVADSNGDWMVLFDPMAANATSQDMTITGSQSATITVSDVRVGEVWLGSGQSNMQRPLSDDDGATDAINDPDLLNYNIHFFDVTSSGGNVAQTAWEPISVSSALDFSATHFFFGRHLAQNLPPDVPLGLIASAVGATSISKWATCAGSGGLYTGQIVPLQPYAIRGATWYQGEWDARGKGSEDYYTELPCLINEWRSDWGQGNFPFYVVQMPKMGIGKIHIIRDAEAETSISDPMVEMIVTLDLPDGGDAVHPPKEPFGVRLANLALKHLYGNPSGIALARSPVYNQNASFIDNDSIYVVFDDVGGSGLSDSNGQNLAEWEITDSSGDYVPAAAEVDFFNTSIVKVWSNSIPCPVSARYAFRPNPIDNNLVSLTSGLPASPIREVTPTSGGCSGTTCNNDGTCDVGEDQCSCPNDCGPPPTTETSCSDGEDNDCDGDIDCDDSDCAGDPSCPTTCDNDTICDPGEDCNNCSNDCDGKTNGNPSGRYCCGNGVAEGPEGNGTICNGNF